MDGNAAIAGSLSFINLPELFQILGGNNCTGVLYLSSQYAPTTGKIYFVNGNPVNASNGSVLGIKAIYSLFGWADGKFEFLDEKVNVDKVVKNSRMEIVLDALRMIDDGVIKRVGPKDLDPGKKDKSGESKSGQNSSSPIIKGRFIDYSYVIDEEAFIDGGMIAKEGGTGTWIWVVLEGVVKISRETDTGPITISHLGEGTLIGTLTSLIRRDSVRTATATAVGDVQLGVLDTERLFAEFSALSPEFKGLISSLDGRLKKITDKTVELYMKKEKNNGFHKGKKLIMEAGSKSGGIFTILEGETYLARKTKKGYLPLLTLEKEDVFGRLPFLDIGHEPRSAAVLASKNLKVNKLDAKNLQKEYDQFSKTLRILLEHLGDCLAVTTRTAFHLQERK